MSAGSALLLCLALSSTLAAAGAVARLRRRLEEVARAEHELRGPAGALLLAVERMRHQPAARRHARTLEVELDRLRGGLADLTSARTGGDPRPGGPAGTRTAAPPRRSPVPPARSPVVAPVAGPVDLGAFARGALACWAPALKAAGRPVTVDWRAGSVVADLDRGRLAQVLGNLVANAAEHGRGPVELRGRRFPGGVRIELRNAVGGQPGASREAEPPAVAIVADRGRGLGIAAQAAAALGGRLTIGRRAGEVVVGLELPVPAGVSEIREAPRPIAAARPR